MNPHGCVRSSEHRRVGRHGTKVLRVHDLLLVVGRGAAGRHLAVKWGIASVLLLPVVMRGRRLGRRVAIWVVVVVEALVLARAVVVGEWRQRLRRRGVAVLLWVVAGGAADDCGGGRGRRRRRAVL